MATKGRQGVPPGAPGLRGRGGGEKGLGLLRRGYQWYEQQCLWSQACRGSAMDEGVQLDTDSAGTSDDSVSHYLSLPESTAVMFACSPGYVAFLNPMGSMFLQTLLEFLKGEERQLELARLMTRINWKVAFHCEAKGEHEGYKEMPCFVTNMVREVYPFAT